MSCPRDIDNAGVGDLPASHKEGVDGLPLPRFSEAPSNLQVSLSRVRSAQRFSDEFPPSPDTVPTPEASSKAVSTDFEPAATLADTWAMSMSTSRAEGKRAARAIDIMPRRPASGVYGVPGQSSGGCSSSSAGPSTATSPIAIPIYAATDDLPHTAPGDDRMEILQDLVEEIVSFSKNKEGEETVPTLPPLSFPSSQFSPDDFYPASSSTSGPSSFGSTFSAPLSSPSINHAGHARRTLTAPMEPLTRMPSRRRSLSNLSIHSSHSVTTRVKGKLRSASPARLVRRIFSKNDSPVSAPVSPLATPRNEGDESAGCFTPWRWDAKQRFREPIDLDRLLYDGTDLAKAHALYWPNVLPAETGMLGAKGRSYSDPFPSVFDVVLPATGRDTFIPLEQAATPPPPPRSAFVDRLPRELQLHILGFVVGIYEQEHARRVREGEWTALTAAKHKWVGREQGVRELVRMSRVCKAWHSLVFDGQLWTTLDLRAFPKLSSTSIMQLGRAAGYLAGSLDLAGHANLQSSTLEHLTNSLSASAGPFVGETRLTNLNLAGCRALTTVALHYILERSPAIELLDVKGVPGVTNETCEVLSRSCPHLTTLNMSRCKSLSGLGIRLLTARALGAGCPLPLRDLRLCGMKGVTDGVLKDLGRTAPYLEVLDLSYCRDLHNTSLGAFVAVEDEAGSSSTVLLSARQAGLPANQSSPFRRRITRLRHLSLSHCPLLTDDACAHLAHATPSLELLELAGIEALQDEGLVLLLRTLPRLRKLDLEDAKNLSNAVLRALMPQENVPCALEHLTMSGCSFSNEPLLALMQAAPRLRVLEADNSFISSAAAREFVALARARAARDAVLVAIDSHTVSANTVNELASTTRPRLGWRAHTARKLAYVDGADKESCVQNEGGPQDECDPARVVLKTFFGWLEVDKVAAARQKRRRAARQLNTSGETAASEGEEEVGGAARARWWAPGGAGRRSSMAATAAMLEIGNERDGCVVM